MITVSVNNREYQCENPQLEAFLKEIGFANLDNMAIAVNETIISKKNIAAYTLQNDDKVILITATYGG